MISSSSQISPRRVSFRPDSGELTHSLPRFAPTGGAQVTSTLAGSRQFPSVCSRPFRRMLLVCQTNRYAQLALGLDETQAAADKLGVGGDGRLANGPRRTCAACVTLRMDSIHFPRQRDVPPRCHKHERKSTPETGRRSRGRRVWDLPLRRPGMTTLICAVVPDWLTERCLSSSVRLQVS